MRRRPGSWRRRGRLAVLALLSLLPGFAKRPLYRVLFGYRIGAGVRIGVALIDALQVDLAPGCRHRSLERDPVCRQTRARSPGAHRHAQHHPRRRAGRLGDYADVMRLNVLNAIPDHDCTTEPESVLEVGAGSGDHLRPPHRLHGPGDARQERHRRRPQLVALDPQPAGDGTDRDRRLLLPGQRGAAGAGREAPERVHPGDRARS